jgi:NADPH:quinone reductase-like Zn-dependent oxidoreductase
MSDRMRLVRQESFGGPEVLRIVDAERPTPMGTEVLVRVHAAGVNPVDWKTRAGEGLLRTLPLTVGWDVSGVVEEVGLGVTRFDVGDEVFGMPWFPRAAGAYAEYVAAPSRQFARKPAGMSHVQAAGLPLAGLTAWQVLVDTAQIQAGQRVLITAAAGGVGHLAVQIAKSRGAYVIGTARAAKHGFLRELGADEVIDYTQVEPASVVGDLDMVFDPVNATDACDWLPSIKPGGLLVPFGAEDEQALSEAAAERSVRTRVVLVEPDGHGLEALADLVEAGELRVEIDTTLPLDQAGKAHEIGEGGRTRGKIVLNV